MLKRSLSFPLSRNNIVHKYFDPKLLPKSSYIFLTTICYKEPQNITCETNCIALKNSFQSIIEVFVVPLFENDFSLKYHRKLFSIELKMVQVLEGYAKDLMTCSMKESG